jgi:hypothetical protein
MTAYTPNLNDLRIQKRAKKAYAFCIAVASRNPAGNTMSVEVMSQHFGNVGRGLGKWLKETLLICTDDYFNKNRKIAKKYRLNERGASYIRDCLIVEQNASKEVLESFDDQLIYEHIADNYGDDLLHLKFRYRESTYRLWHGLQHMPRRIKPTIFDQAGLSYHYDINNCAPTIIQQYAQQQGLDTPMFGIDYYINNKQQTRQHIADLISVDIKLAKKIIQAVTNGAKLSEDPRRDIFKLLDKDLDKLNLLKKDQWMTQYRQDFKQCWEAIHPEGSETKWHTYFRLEREVLDTIIKYLKDNNTKHFLEHDGFYTDKPIDIPHVEELIRVNHNFILSLSGEVYSKNNNIDKTNNINRNGISITLQGIDNVLNGSKQKTKRNLNNNLIIGE